MRRRRTAHRFDEKRRTIDVLIDEKVDFSGLMLPSDVLEGLKSSGFERPSPIQLKAIPLGRCGLDLIAQAKSGTGKTCVFSVIALENINLDVKSIQVLVLAPTREIAVQIKDVMCSIGQHLEGLQTHVFIGGLSLEDDKNHLKQCHIAIGTPGRIKHLIESKLLQTTSIRLFILDEADKLLEENFQDQINWIYSTLPGSKQMLALSATYPEHLAEKLKNYMKNPTFVRLNATDPALEGIRHYRCVVPSDSLPHKVFHTKVQNLLQLLSKLSFHQCLIFSNYHIRARNLSETLAKNGWPCTYISGSQGQNERLSAMAKLKEFKCRILISTDLTSRGIDAERVNLVINMDLPRDSETYLHRVGRAGRFGTYGVAVNFVAEGKEVTSLDDIEANCGVRVTPLPGDVSKLLSQEMMDASPRSSETCEVKSLIDVQHKDTLNNTVNKQGANSDTPVELSANEVVQVEYKKDDSRMIKSEEARTIRQEVDKDIQIEHHETKNKIDSSEEVVEGEETDSVQHKDVGKGETVETKYEKTQEKIHNVERESNTPQAVSIADEIKYEQTESKMKITKENNNVRQEEVVVDKKTKDGYQLSTDRKIPDKEEASSVSEAALVAGEKVGMTGEEINIGEKDHRDIGREVAKVKMNCDDEPSNMLQAEHEKTENKIKNIEEGRDETVEAGVRDQEKLSDVSDCGRECLMKEGEFLTKNIANKNTGDTTEECGKNEIIFRNHEAKLFPRTEQFKREDCVTDDSESEFSSSEESESSDSSSSQQSCDSHVPISCKDFDNVFEAYLRSSVNEPLDNSKKHWKKESPSASQALRSTIPEPEDGNDGKPVGASNNAIYANESRPLPSETNADARVLKSTESRISKDSNDCKPNEAGGDLGATQTNDGQNSQETMFYGATPDDVTAYMAELPAEWKSTWYRVYDRQTKFIMKYTKFCQDNF